MAPTLFYGGMSDYVVTKRFPAARIVGKSCIALDVGDRLIVSAVAMGKVRFLRASDSLGLDAEERVFNDCTEPVSDK